MVWYKAWLETRWRFVIGFAVLSVSAFAAVLSYPEVAKLLPELPKLNFDGVIAERLAEEVAIASEYRGYVWSQWFTQNMSQQWTLFAVLLGTGGLLAGSAGAGTLFTLSLPASRERWLGVRAAVGLGELLVLAFVPSLVLPLLSPTIGESYGIKDALVHSACIFVGGSVFFSLTMLLSTMLTGIWRPLLIALCAAFVLGLIEQLARGASPYSLLHVMSGASYFRGSGLPWLGLVVSAALSALMLYGATRSIAQRDF